MEKISGLEGVHIYLSRNPSDSVQLCLTDSQKLKDRCMSWSIILYEDLFVLKSFCEQRKIFFLLLVQINLAGDFQALINEHQTKFAHVRWNCSTNHISNRFLASKMTSDVDMWVSRAEGIFFYHFAYRSQPPLWTSSCWTKWRSCWRLAPFPLTLTFPCPDFPALKILKLLVLTVFIWGYL